MLKRLPHRILIASLLVAAGLLSLSLLTSQATAQTGTELWTSPVNVSRSGAASLPLIAAAPDGTLHLVWWDQKVGTLYARSTASVTETTWTAPNAVGAVYGKRVTDVQTNQVTQILPPQTWRLAATTKGEVDLFWVNEEQHLQTASVQGAGFGGAEELSTSASALETTPDANGGLQLIYVDNADTANQPAGIYYRSRTGASWSKPALVVASPYFRALQPQDVHLSVASNGLTLTLATWDDPQLGQSVYARSTDAGSTWSTPQVISSTQSGHAQHAYVIAVPNGGFLRLWQDSTMGGCGFLQSQSTDGGLTWSAPQKVLASYQRCQENLSFTPDDQGRVWLIGRLPQDPKIAINTMTTAVWDGTHWSDPADIALNFYDEATQRTINLNCLGLTFNGPVAGLVGCDAQNDIWAARNAIALNDFQKTSQAVWDETGAISDGNGVVAVEDSPALIVDPAGEFYAMWSQSPTGDEAGSLLYAAVYGNDHWGRTVAVLRSPDRGGGLPSAAFQPSLALDPQDKVHVVWSNGTNGDVLYSWAYTHDYANPAGWADPIKLPALTDVTSWPDIAADPRGQHLYVVYAAPYNEQRGIYLTRSDDNGTTWSQPVVIFDAVAAQVASVDKPRLAFDPQTGTLHAVWLQQNLPGAIGPQAIDYARSTDNGQTWSAPFKVIAGAVDWPRVAVPGAGQVYLAWNQAVASQTTAATVPYNVWGIYSPEAGQRWGSAKAISGFEKVSGPIGLAADGMGHMHLLALGQAVGKESALYHAEWNGQGWNDRETLRLGQEAIAGNAVTAAFAPQSGRLQTLLRLWSFNQDHIGQFAAFAAGRSVTPIALTPLPTFTPQPTVTPGPTVTVMPTATPRPQIQDTQRPATSSGPSGLIIGALLAVAIVGFVFGVTIWNRRR